MPGQLDWDDLRHFLAIVARGSISGAATLLKVNHSTVLRRITALEDHLQLRLFDRLPAGYTLTAEGRALADGLAGVQEHIETAQRGLQGGDLAVRGVLRLTTTDTLLQGLLLPLLARFHALHPAVQLEIVVNNSFLNLTQREADVAVRGSNQPPENLVGRRVGNIQTALHAAQSYLPALGTPPDVAQARWVALDESLAHLEQARWLRARVAPERIALRVDTLVGMADAVAAGLGVGMLLCPLAAQRSGLVQLEPPDPALDTQIWVLTHPGLKAVARVRALTDFLFDELSVHPGLSHAAAPPR
jgi:DNA-binding transcriptional LysR family regulator